MIENDYSNLSIGSSSLEDINFDNIIPTDQTQFNYVASIPPTLPTIPPISDNPSTLLNTT